MEQFYYIFVIIHICCAIIFVGYLFFDVVIFTRAKSKLKHLFGFSDQSISLIERSIISTGIKIMPVCLILLVLTGGMMLNSWIDFKNINSMKDYLLLTKVGLALLIFIMVAINLTCRAIGRKAVFKNIHIIALVFSFVIVICAKLIYFV